ncbi:MAG: GNAT family N-acetyltransferase [Clostridia bacterium]|nr:GNAT family N-acetyltransferase [Clostridia bacterium]
MIEVYEKVADLPDGWDAVVGSNIYLTRKFMAFMERADDAPKKYYAVFDGDKIDTVFMTQQRKGYNLGMFAKFDFKIKMTLVYVPLSVTRAGIAYGTKLSEAMEYVRKLPGYKIFLNLPDINPKGYAKGLTCPKCELLVRWDTFEDYMSTLRSNYRYRFKKALDKSHPLSIRYLSDGSEFTHEMYTLYEQVYAKSRIRVEKLSEDFFRGEFFKIFVFEENGAARGFVQMLENGDELVFEFVGVDYKYNKKYDTYLAMLLEIVRYGINHGFKTIDFGQTADDTKLKLGCKYEYLWAYLTHKNPLLNALCKRLAPKLQYRPLAENFSVFKEDESVK